MIWTRVYYIKIINKTIKIIFLNLFLNELGIDNDIANCYVNQSINKYYIEKSKIQNLKKKKKKH